MRQFLRLAPIFICVLLTIPAGTVLAWQTKTGERFVDAPPGKTTSSSAVTIDHVDGLTPGGYIEEGATLTFHIRLYNDGEPQTAISNGFRIYGDNLNWTSVSGAWNPAYNWDPTFGTPCFFDFLGMGVFINVFSTGDGADTIGFAGITIPEETGLPAGFDDIAYTITVGPITGEGQVLAIDSSWWYPANYWVWGTEDGERTYPAWDGPYEFSMNCCVLRGDIDQTGQVDPMDLMYMVEWLWMGGPDIQCLDEADVDGSGIVDPFDLMYLVEWLWQGGPDPVPCQ